MASGTKFFSWLKTRSSKKQKTVLSPPIVSSVSSSRSTFNGPPSVADITASVSTSEPSDKPVLCGQECCRSSVCRQSLMLPPIPYEKLPYFISDRYGTTDSPSSHVYEEIPLSAFEVESSSASPDAVAAAVSSTNTSIQLEKLDLTNAKEVGPYLVVPIKHGDTTRRVIAPAPNPVALSNDMFVRDKRRKSLPFSTHLSPTKESVSDSLEQPSPEKPETKDNELERLANRSSERIRLDRQRRNSDSGRCSAVRRESTSAFKCTRLSSRTNSIISCDSGNSSSHSTACSDTSMQPYSDDTTDSYNSYNMSSNGSLELPKHVRFRTTKHNPVPLVRNAEIQTAAGLSPISVSIPELPSCVKHLKTDSLTTSEAFSDYDVRTDEATSSPESPSSPQAEYEYYLGKVKQNLRLKDNVHKIILSESSDYETVSTSYDDTASFTTVTSASEDGGLSGKHSAFRACHPRTRSTGGIRFRADSSSSNSSRSSRHKPQTVRQTKHRSAKHQRHPTVPEKTEADPEFYSLPDFQQSSYVDADATCGTIPTTKVVEMNPSDKLSCRVTKLRAEDVLRPAAFTAASKQRQPATSSSASSTFISTSHSSGQNRMLSDMMRRNHDRLTVIF